MTQLKKKMFDVFKNIFFLLQRTLQYLISESHEDFLKN